jgi:hypothetical protein
MISVEIKKAALKSQVFERLRELRLSKKDVEWCFAQGFRQGAVIVSVTRPFSNCIVCPPNTPARESIGVLLAWVNRVVKK